MISGGKYWMSKYIYWYAAVFQLSFDFWKMVLYSNGLTFFEL